MSDDKPDKRAYLHAESRSIIQTDLDSTSDNIDTPENGNGNKEQKTYLQTDTIRESATPDPQTVTTHSYNDTTASVELTNRNNRASSIKVNSVIQQMQISHPHHEAYVNSGSVKEYKTPNTVPSPLSPSESDTANEVNEHKDYFPDTDADHLNNMSSTTVGSIGSDGEMKVDIKVKDFEDLAHRLEAAQKLGGMTPIDESQEENMGGHGVLGTSSARSSVRGTEHFTASTNLQNQPFYRINKRGLYGYIRQDFHTSCIPDGLDELRAGWVELFFDLVFVACIVHLSAESSYSIPYGDDTRRRLGSSECSDYDGDYGFVLTSFAQFALLTTFWMEQVMYTTHFVLNQHIDEIFRILYMACVLAMGIFIANDSAYHIGFFCSYALTRVVSVCMFLRVLGIPRARAHALYHIILHILIILVLVGLIGFQFQGCALQYFMIYFFLWIVEYLSGVLQWTLSDIFCKEDQKKHAIALPLNVPHIAERYGLFVMIILGESLIAIMTTDIGELNLYQKFEWIDGKPPDLVKVFFFLGIFILCYGIGRLYYGCQPSEEAILVGIKNHALRISKNRARLYIHSHQILFIALLGWGLGIKLAGKHLLDKERRQIDILLPGYSLFTIILCLNIIRAAHPFEANKKVWTFRFVVMIILGICPLFAIAEYNNSIIWGVQMLCIAGMIGTDVEAGQRRADEIHHQKSKRNAAKEYAEHEKEKKSFRKHLRHMVSGIGLL